jgi:hypothetical protein
MSEDEKSLDTELEEEVDEGQEDVVDPQKGAGEAEEDQPNDPPEQKKKPQDRDTNEQFKAARVAAEKERDTFKNRQDAFAKKYGYSSFEEMEAAQQQKEEEEQRQAYINAGINPDLLNQAIENHPAIRQAQEITAKSKIETEISSVKSKEFFNELEPEIRKVLEINPNLKGEDVYCFIYGKKAGELTKSARSLAEKRTIANISDRGGRGITDGNEASQDDEYEMSEQGKKMTLAFGNDPKEVSKLIKKKRS